MHIISRKRLLEFGIGCPDACQPLDDWYRLAKEATWRNIAEVRQVYPHADLYGIYTVFNIGGNKYRLVVELHYDTQIVLIRHVLTHAEYDRDKWKQEMKRRTTELKKREKEKRK
jgi:mRNA interferase HigB